MPEIRRRPLTGETMATFSRRGASRIPDDHHQRYSPCTPSQDFDWDATLTRVRKWLDEMYASESNDSDPEEEE